jgi:hypothetical protein
MDEGDEGMDALTGNAELDTASRQLDELLVEAEEHLQLTGCIATLEEVQRTVVTALLRGSLGARGRRGPRADPGQRRRHPAPRARATPRCLASSRQAFGLER